ncbi:MAG: glycine-rich domain-containing protein-like [Cyanobacteria bacterium J06560_5]
MPQVVSDATLQTPVTAVAKDAVEHSPLKTEADKKFLAVLSAVDFGPIAYKLINPEEGEGWSLQRATQAIEQYRRFLFLLYKYPDEKIVPSRETDEVWHTHILDTSKYREDCDRLFGKFMDHWPYFGLKDAAERQELNDAFSSTQQLLETHFGKAKG